MPKDVNFLVRKKTLVPTKRQLMHMYRSDWKPVWKIDFMTAVQLFNYLNSNATIVFDAQFTKLLRDKFGTGIYSVVYYKKGQNGFKSLIKCDIKEDVWCKLPRHQTAEDREKAKLISEARKIKRLAQNAETEEERSSAHAELNNLMEELDFTDDLLKLEKGNSINPYLKTTMPVFKYHEYLDYNYLPRENLIILQEKRKPKQEKIENNREQEVKIVEQVDNRIW